MKILCIDNIDHYDKNEHYFPLTIGKWYELIKYDIYFWIVIDDLGQSIYFSKKNTNYFITISEERKLKIEKIS